MTLDIDSIVADKLRQLDEEGTIRKRIEDALEKAILGALDNALGGYELRRGIEQQLAESVHAVAKDCGLAAYNGYIAEKAAQIVAEAYREDMGEKVRAALDRLIVRSYEDVKLSDIFKRYREWVCEHTEEREKYERERYTGSLDVSQDGNWTKIVCRFADHPLETGAYGETPEIEIRFHVWGHDETARISTLFFDGHFMKESLRVGPLTDFEAFVLNLYYNETKIALDVDEVDDSDGFDIDI